MKRWIQGVALLLLSLAGAAKGQKPARDLTEASLEDLMNIEVTTVSKKEQKLSQTPAAVFVITQEDIRRSGMTSLPDLLRMVPGLDVGQIQRDSWAVSARGFNDQYANKLQVLVDGRSVYSPRSSGVFWDQQDMLLEDIERIEVIRGPGATLWGANAVNGVINIITKPAAQTQGALTTTGLGDQGQALGAFRYGGQLGDAGNYRAFIKYLNGPRTFDVDQKPIAGSEGALTAGFRTDLSLSGKDSLMMEGSLHRARSGSQYGIDMVQPPYFALAPGVEESDSGNLLANWSRRQSARSKTELRVYFDRYDESNIVFQDIYSTIDVDFQHELSLGESHGLIWGAGFRDYAGSVVGSLNFSLSRPSFNLALASGFLQDQWTLAGGHFAVVLGSKFEYNSFSGANVQPGARLLWTPDSHHTGWAAISRAVRTPSVMDRELQAAGPFFPGDSGTTTGLGLYGNPSFRDETLLAYELGYRYHARRRFSVDLAAFYNIYHHLHTYEPGEPFLELDPQPAHLIIPLVAANLMNGKTYGAELSTNWNITERWRLIPSYSWTRLALRLDPSSQDQQSTGADGVSPRSQFQIRSNLDLSRKLQFDAAIYHASELPTLEVGGYTRVDARLGYKPRSDLEISLSGQNLQGGRHTEFVSIGPYSRAAIGRSFFLKLTWGF